ncbi:MAG: solute:sodium symporter family transporter [Chthoniobacterales bacterium]
MLVSVVTFVLFTAFVAIISWVKSRDEDLTHSKGYFLAGRSLPWFVIAGSLMLTNISTEQLVGLNGWAYAGDASVMAWEAISAVAMVAMAIYFLPRYLKGDITTVPELLETRFGPAVRSIVSVMFLLALTISFLPFVIYSGALAMNGLFPISDLVTVSTESAIWIFATSLCLIGGAYAIFGGLKAVAISDTVNGVGLLLGGFAIPILGLIQLGDGDIGEALKTMTENSPEKLSPIGRSDSPVPFDTLFSGILFISIYYWCTNQAIVQRTFGAKSLAEAQKGVLFAALLKIVCVGILVLPGLIAFHMFGADLENQDMAYPALVAAVLPVWAKGFFAAVMFGAIMSSFNSGLHSASTLFGVDIYKQFIRPGATDQETVKAGKVLGAILVVVCIFLAPTIAQAPDGLFSLMKKLTAFVNIPILAVVMVGIVFQRTTPLAAYVALPLGILFYGYFGFFREGVFWEGMQLHWLHVAGLNFVLLVVVMLAIRAWKPVHESVAETVAVPSIDLTSWGKTIPASVVLMILLVALYAYLGHVGS